MKIASRASLVKPIISEDEARKIVQEFLTKFGISQDSSSFKKLNKIIVYIYMHPEEETLKNVYLKLNISFSSSKIIENLRKELSKNSNDSFSSIDVTLLNFISYVLKMVIKSSNISLEEERKLLIKKELLKLGLSPSSPIFDSFTELIFRYSPNLSRDEKELFVKNNIGDIRNLYLFDNLQMEKDIRETSYIFCTNKYFTETYSSGFKCWYPTTIIIEKIYLKTYQMNSCAKKQTF